MYSSTIYINPHITLGYQDERHVNSSTPNWKKLSNDDIKYKFEHTKLDFEDDLNLSKLYYKMMVFYAE